MKINGILQCTGRKTEVADVFQCGYVMLFSTSYHIKQHFDKNLNGDLRRGLTINGSTLRKVEVVEVFSVAVLLIETLCLDQSRCEGEIF